jgi:probable HAF family extracellular repeat protein
VHRPSPTALACLVAIAGSVCMPGIGHAQTTYTLTQVTANGGSISTFVTGLDDEGGLALTVTTGSTVNTYLWRRGTQVNIGGLTPSPQFVESGGLNDLVQIVGTTLSPTSGTFTGFIWQQGHMTGLPSPAGSAAAFATQLNLLGQIVGVAYDANFNGQAIVWSQGTFTLLPGIAGGDFSQATGINIRGEIVGYSNDAANIPNAVIWRHGVLTVLVPNSIPSAINDEGQVVGTTRSSPSTPFLWQNGVTTPLPPIPGMAAAGTAQAINDRSQIVGSLGNLAVLWQNDVATDLNSQVAKGDPLQPYVQLQTATLINNLGQIVANGVDSRNPAIGQQYLLTPAH